MPLALSAATIKLEKTRPLEQASRTLEPLADAEAVASLGRLSLRRCTSPREAPCVENIAAWLSLWASVDAAGISSLLANGTAMRNALPLATYSSLMLSFYHTCDTAAQRSAGCGAGRADGGRCCRARLQLVLGLSAVFPHRKRSVSRALDSLLRVSRSEDSDRRGCVRGLELCSVCTSSTLRVELPRERWAAARGDAAARDDAAATVQGRIGAEPTCQLGSSAPAALGVALWPLGGAGCARASPSRLLEMSAKCAGGWVVEPQRSAAAMPKTGSEAASSTEATRSAGDVGFVQPSPPLLAQLVLAPRDDRHGVLLVELSNAASEAVHVEGELVLPWQLLPLWHTLTIIGDDVSARAPLFDVAFEAAPLRVPQRLGWNGTLPAASSSSLAFEYITTFSHVDELPSDSSRGVDLEPAAIRYTPHHRTTASATPHLSRLLFTNSALLPLPLPDESMPYNVISFTCTLLTIFVSAMLRSLLYVEQLSSSCAPNARY
uniref:GPI transamidase component PIG-T n=1 Tax=Calcidiscus leptoporus TaxID=127549 RepID=A0A7S0J258_9EUKA